MKTSHTKAIVIKTFDSKDADKVVQLVNNKGEKINVLAKGIKKPHSRKAHAVDLANYISIATTDGYQLPILTEVKLLNEHHSWKSEYNSLILVQIICEVLSNFMQEGVGNIEVFKLTKEVLSTQNANTLICAFCFFVINLLNLSGNLADLKKSVVTEKDIDLSKVSYIESSLGLLNRNESEFSKPLDPSLVKTMQFYKNNSLNNSLRISLDNLKQTKLLNLLLSWVEIVQEKELKSRRLLMIQ